MPTLIAAADSCRELRATMRSAGPRVAALHHAAQRLLDRRTIVIPFAERLAELLEVFADRVECRRAYPMLLSIIEAATLLHQRQRRFLDRVLGEVHDPVDPLPSPLTAKDVCRRLKTARSTVAGSLPELEDKGFLNTAEAAAGGRGRPPKAWKQTVGRTTGRTCCRPPQKSFPWKPWTKWTNSRRRSRGRVFLGNQGVFGRLILPNPE